MKWVWENRWWAEAASAASSRLACGSSGDPYIDSYARRYRDGFEGKKPECPSLTSESSKTVNIASIV